MSDLLLSLQGLTLSYGREPVLAGAGFDVRRGDYIGIVGPNGSGKTTLVKTLAGLHQADSGTVTWPGGRPRIGYVPQKVITNDVLFPATAREIASMGLLVGGGKARQGQKKIEELFRRLKIQDIARSRIGRLSGGQQQRVLLARALASEPQLLMLDEPTSALDPSIRADFYELLGELNTTQGMTIMLVSHDIGSVGKFARKLLYLDRKVVFYGDFDEFCHSDGMTGYFGNATQHLMCGRHEHGNTCQHAG